MSERPKSRKRNTVEGNVAEVKRQGQGLGLDRVGEGVSFVSRLFQFFRKQKNSRGR
ncbi:MAG: hypothetical protein IJI44_00820 [Erysipelotrichaceae bacterium]|nr:hypothetical protein [Erysipelotrichaceae bacterium]